MIEFLAMAFFVAQPLPPGAATTDGGTRPPMLGSVPLKNPVEITAKLITGERNSATFTGDVNVKHGTLDLKCDKMVAFYTPSREVTRVECTGGVQAQDGDRFARGERAEYDVPSGVLVVTGSPEGRQGTTYMRGTEVRLTTVGNKLLEVRNGSIVFETAPAGTSKKGKGGAKKP